MSNQDQSRAYVELYGVGAYEMIEKAKEKGVIVSVEIALCRRPTLMKMLHPLGKAGEVVAIDPRVARFAPPFGAPRVRAV